eukprot:NODE_9481_length_1421_cov_9.642968.p1 GENE.NODE_9481_length_1421_cov_9.642968~~NODE_9481_length_1421_cov_9.642968.p1  ORF type:complete len:330 (-),score=88.54 NODE_9481_length_1421_cov_9.642968:40-1029(-)
MDALHATSVLQGSFMGVNRISIEPDRRAADGAKLIVHNLPARTSWQALKDHFASVVPVSVANVTHAPGSTADVYAVGPRRPSPSLPTHALPPLQAPRPYSAAPTAGPGMAVGEVRFQSAEAAATAVATLDGTDYLGARISVRHDLTSKDATRLLIGGLPQSASWHSLKVHFTSIGEVAYTNVTPIAAPRPAFGKGIGKGAATGQNLGEVWFYDEPSAAKATELFDGFLLHDVPLRVLHDRQDLIKVQILNLPPHCTRQELTDTFTYVGPVALAMIHEQGQVLQRPPPPPLPPAPDAYRQQPRQDDRCVAAAAPSLPVALAPAPALAPVA